MAIMSILMVHVQPVLALLAVLLAGAYSLQVQPTRPDFRSSAVFSVDISQEKNEFSFILTCCIPAQVVR